MAANECTFCGTDIYELDPVFVEEPTVNGVRKVGQFCNYACLAQHIEEEDLEAGACCQIDLS